MRIDVPDTAVKAGFTNEPVGTHTSRTLMLSELRLVLASAGPASDYADYLSAAVDSNAIQKATRSTREKTFRHLRELYALRQTVPLFSGMQALWDVDTEAQPLLAGFCAVARDPVLRCTLDAVTGLEAGESISPQDLAVAVNDSFPGHYNPGVIARIGRNVASSWAQVGFLQGRRHKTRRQPCADPANVAYALYLGHLAGARGGLLFTTPWARMLDRSEPELRILATVAARRGWLEYREAGGVTEMTFRHFESLIAEHLG